MSHAEIICRYLLHRPVSRHAATLYAHAIALPSPKLDPYQKKIIDFAFSHPWSIGPLDGALALTNPHAELRRRIFVMFAILETDPVYWDYFLPRKRSWPYLFYSVFIGVRAGIKAIVGLVLLRVAIR